MQDNSPETALINLIRIAKTKFSKGGSRNITKKEMDNFLSKALTYIQRQGKITVVNESTDQEYGFFFKPGVIEKMMEFKKCKNDKALADMLEIDKSYLSRIKHRQQPASANVVIKAVMLMGNMKGNWDAMFDIRPYMPKIPSNSPKNNMKKFNSEMAYERFSSSKRDPEAQEIPLKKLLTILSLWIIL